MTRTARVRSFAKINLDLRVLHRRTDGFHELRTVFQTISLYDTLDIAFTPSRKTRLELDGNIDIPDNLVLRAAQAVFDHARLTGHVSFGLHKRIPLGAGLGGGSSNAAAVLLALPVLTGKRMALDNLRAIAAELGSDVPFFLLGGAALGLGRGTELYPLPELPAIPGLLAAPGIHVSTPEAYRALARPLTTDCYRLDTNKFQSLVWALGESPAEDWKALCANDFESVVFKEHPQLESIKRSLHRLGARPALMTGSGSALFGLFPSREESLRARAALKVEQVFPISLVSRRRYQDLWRRQLEGHRNNNVWPPQTRYGR